MSSRVTVAHRQRSRRLEPPTPRVALVLFAAIVVGLLLYLGRHALTPFIVGALLIYILDPAVDFVARLRIFGRTLPRGLAVLVVYVITFIVIVQGLSLLLGPLISQILEYVRDLPRLLAALESLAAQLRATYGAMDLPPSIRQVIDDALADLGRGAGGIDFSSLLPIARTVLGTVAGFFGFLIIPIWAFYILRDRVHLAKQFDAALPPAWRTDARAVISIVERVVGRWVRAQILLGLIIGAATYLGLLALGFFVDERFLQFAVLLAVIAGILELLPIIGPIIAMIPTLLVALTTSDPFVAVVGVLVLYTAVQQLENAILVPKIQGQAVELHPSVVIFALILGAAIAGLPGAIFSIPIVAAGRNVYRYMFRRLSEDDPAVPPADAPDMQPYIEGAEADSGADAEADRDAAAADVAASGSAAAGTHGEPASADRPIAGQVKIGEAGAASDRSGGDKGEK